MRRRGCDPGPALASPRTESSTAIRVVILDDHPAMRAGLTGLLTGEPQLQPLGAVACAAELYATLHRARADVVLLDYHLPDDDGLHVCRTLKQRDRVQGVLLYSAFAGPRLAIPAALAGADGLLHTSAPAPELYRAIRAVARGERVMPPIPRELLALAGAYVSCEDLPVLAMAAEGADLACIAEALCTTAPAIRARTDAMIEQLRLIVPSTTW
jgi:DNA-binding NarL/FixJ family response regulator